MSDLPVAVRLAAARFHRNVLVGDLARTDRWIAQLEREVSEEQARQKRAKVPPPEWALQRGVGRGLPTIHTTLGESADRCWGADVDYVRIQPTTREKALRVLTEQQAVPCDMCRPDTILGLL